MKEQTKLIELLNESIEILSLCEYREQAEWFKQCREGLENNQIPSVEFQKMLNEIGRRLPGMGSFADLHLVPKVKTDLTAQDLRLRQWDLVKELDKAITQLKISTESNEDDVSDSDSGVAKPE